MRALARTFVLCALMLGASGMAIALRPHQKIADLGPKIDLQTIVPRSFGEWREEIVNSAQIVDPQQKATLDKIYSQTLTRTYVNAQGYRIMLSLAYGSDQSDSMQVHKPEICYPAQGFTLHDKHGDLLNSRFGTLPITRVSTSLGMRNEPITYWTTLGDQVIKSSGIQKKLVEMSYGLSGKIPDGMLIRVSSIDSDNAHAFVMHDRFSNQMLEALTPEALPRLVGKPNRD